MTAITISINAQTYSCKCATEHQHDLSTPPLDPSKMCEKILLNTYVYSLVDGDDFDIILKRRFKEQHTTNTRSHPFTTLSPFQSRQCWEACSFTGKAIMSAHRQKIACCANRFRASLQGTQCSSLYHWQYFFFFFDALLHTSKTLCLKISLCFYVVFHTI